MADAPFDYRRLRALIVVDLNARERRAIEAGPTPAGYASGATLNRIHLYRSGQFAAGNPSKERVDGRAKHSTHAPAAAPAAIAPFGDPNGHVDRFTGVGSISQNR